MSNLTASHKEDNMTNQTPLPLRNDTILGVCEAIGQDFGFNPLWLRLAFVSTIFFAPTAGVAAYLGLGVIVAATRYFAPNKPASEQLVDAKAVEMVDDEALPMAA
jgi:phage shock protein PspC (stress-responsive transcriptional regulator)